MNGCDLLKMNSRMVVSTISTFSYSFILSVTALLCAVGCKNEAKIVFDRDVAIIKNDAESFGVLIPGDKKNTSLYAKWDCEEELFWLFIQDERSGTVWHTDGEIAEQPTADLVFKTAKNEMTVTAYYSEELNTPYLKYAIDDQFIDFFDDEYLDVFVCATQEHLNFTTNQEAVQTALNKYFRPAVRAEKTKDKKEKEEQEKIAEEERKEAARVAKEIAQRLKEEKEEEERKKLKAERIAAEIERREQIRIKERQPIIEAGILGVWISYDEKIVLVFEKHVATVIAAWTSEYDYEFIAPSIIQMTHRGTKNNITFTLDGIEDDQTIRTMEGVAGRISNFDVVLWKKEYLPLWLHDKLESLRIHY